MFLSISFCFSWLISVSLCLCPFLPLLSISPLFMSISAVVVHFSPVKPNSVLLSICVRFSRFLSVSVSFCLLLSVSVSWFLVLSVSVPFCLFLSVSVCLHPFLSISACFRQIFQQPYFSSSNLGYHLSQTHTLH